MKAAVYNNSKKLNIEEINKPELKEKGAIIKVHGCGLCGSDIVKLKQDLVKEGCVLGHEVAGEIVELNSNNKDFKLGDEVVLGHHVPCFECIYCKNQNYSMCATFKKTNILPGGFGEYIFVSEDHLNNTVTKIPKSLTFKQAAFMEPVACCLRAVKRADIKKGDNILIIGLGSIGLLMGQVAKHFGACVYGCDIAEERLNFAKQLNFNQVIKYENDKKTSNEIKKLTNDIGADKVIVTAGSNSSVSFSVSSVRNGGTIMVFASVSIDSTAFSNNDIYYRELTVMGSYSPSCKDLQESLDLIEKGIIKLDGKIESFPKVYNLDKINDAIEDTLNSKILKAYIKIAQD